MSRHRDATAVCRENNFLYCGKYDNGVSTKSNLHNYQYNAVDVEVFYAYMLMMCKKTAIIGISEDCLWIFEEHGPNHRQVGMVVQVNGNRNGRTVPRENVGSHLGLAPSS